MSDRRLRALERELRDDPGNPARAAALLTEQRRCGLLREGALELASYAGHEAARLALGEERPAFDGPAEWVLGLQAWGKVPAVVAALAFGRSALASEQTAWRSSDVEIRLEAQAAALKLVAAWIEGPTQERRVACRAQLEVAQLPFKSVLQACARADRTPKEAARAARLAARDAAKTLAQITSSHYRDLLQELGEGADLSDAQLLSPAQRAVSAWALAPLTSEPALVERSGTQRARGGSLYGGYYHPDTIVVRADTKKEAAARFHAALPRAAARDTSADALANYVGLINYSAVQERLWFRTRASTGACYVVPPSCLGQDDWPLVAEVDPPRSLAEALRVDAPEKGVALSRLEFSASRDAARA
jgi:hypothetical protein